MGSQSLAPLALLALVTSTLASPISPEYSHIFSRDDSIPTGFFCYNGSLPNVTIYATGGTIAGSASSNTQTTGYQAGALGVDILIAAVPEMCNVTNVRGVQVTNTASDDITPEILLNMTQQIQVDLDSGLTQGVVVTHGTDTIEETAFFLDLTVKSEKPVVCVGAMRPATAISADGPMNLLEAVTLAASPKAEDRGAMIVLNDRIGSARYTTKTNANSLDTFMAVEQGYLGVFEDVKPVFYYPPTRPYGHQYFNVSNVPAGDGLPKVDILYGYQALEAGLFQAAIDLGAKGIVLAGMGAGGWTSEATEIYESIVNKTEIPVVDSRRPSWGFVGGGSEYSIGGGFLNPQKCRIQLQLALQAGLGREEIRSVFEYVDAE